MWAGLPTVLFLKGEKSQFEVLEQVIDANKFSKYTCSETGEALDLIAKINPVMIFIDFIFDKKDAISILNDFSDKAILDNRFVVVHSDRKENYIHVSALNAGADDYLIKPVNKRVFESKVLSWSKRLYHAGNPSSKPLYKDGDVYVDEDKFSIRIRNVEIFLQRKEFEIISLLFSRPGKVFSRAEIREFIWGEINRVHNRTIDVHIRNLRSKLGPRYIKTVKGVGYSYNAN